MKIKKIDYEYYEWLISQVSIPEGKTFNDLFERMHNTEFVWTVPNDDNRVQDGIDLRHYFLNGRNHELNLAGATMLEILISLSQRVAFIADGDPKEWAWRLLKNLRLNRKSDPLTEDDLRAVDDILDALIWRTYRPDGRGGFFPLKNPMEDQTKVEIWFQMNKYIMEKNLF